VLLSPTLCLQQAFCSFLTLYVVIVQCRLAGKFRLRIGCHVRLVMSESGRQNVCGRNTVAPISECN
jgi:hypothetical protein